MALNTKNLCVSAGVVLSLFGFVRGFEAQSPRAPQSPEELSVAGHLDLKGMQVKQMFSQERGGRNYVFLLRTDRNAFAIVDITNPGDPVLADRNVLREPPGGRVELPASGSVLAIAFVPDGDPKPAATAAPVSNTGLPTESVRLIDLTDPQHPKTIREFNKVTSVARDDGRKLVLIVNNQGLWITSATIVSIPYRCAPRSRKSNPFPTANEG